MQFVPPDICQVYGLSATYLQHQILAPGIELAHLRHPAVEEAGRTERHLVFIHTDVPAGTYQEQVTAGVRARGVLKTGETIIVPAYVDCSAHWNQEHCYLLLAIAPEIFKQRCGVDGVDNLDLLPQLFLPDALLYNLGLALQQEIDNSGLGGQLYIDSLLTTLSTHLLRHYCTHRAIRKVATKGLPNSTLNRVVDYIHAHLDRDVTLANLAAVAQLSPNYFAGQFKQSTGFAPHQYVLRQRIEAAKPLLKRGYEIVQIAQQLGFAHQSHFTRHFKQIVGVTPKRFLAQQ